MDVRLPNGVVIKNVPEGTTKDQIRAMAIRNGLATGADFGIQSDAAAQIPDPGVTQPPAPEGTRVQNPSVLDYAIQGAAAVPIMAAGARGLQLLTRGSKAAPYAGRVAEVLLPRTGGQLAYEGGLGAAAGVAGGLAAEQAPEAYQPLVSMAAGAAVGGLVGTGRNVFDTWVSRGLAGEATQAGLGASQVVGQAKASAQAETAIRANPNLIPTVLRAAEIEKKTGVSLPTLAAANGDTTISSFLQSQIARGENAEFAAAIKQQYEAAEKALTAAQRGKAPTMQEVDAYVKRKAEEVAATNRDIAARASRASERRQEGLERINDRIRELSQVSAPEAGDIGTRLTNLISAKESAVISELSPLYEEVIKNASEAGIALSGQSAQNLRRFAQDTANDDVFAKFPALYSAIVRNFRNAPVAEGTRAADKYKFARSAPTAKDVPLNTLDSLKREVNAAIRDTTDRDQLRKLNLLKDEVNKAIDSVDPAFSVPYREIDRQYALRVGLPFRDAQGVVNINRARFTEDVVPKLTQNASSVRQALNIIGDSPEGLKIVEDAFMFDISKNRGIINTNTGEINPAQLRRYIAQNKDKIDQVPGLRQRLESLSGRVQELRTNRTAILDAEKQARIEQVENLWSQSYGTSGGIRGVVSRALNNPRDLDNLMQITSNDAVAREGVKAALMDDVIQSGNPLELFSTNRQAFDRIFGKKEADNIALIMEAAQRLKDNPFVFRMNIATINKTKLEEITGSRPDTTLGELRNQVLTAPRVFINHMTRFFQNRASKDEAAEVQKFLLDPKNLENTAMLMKELNTKGFTDKAGELMGRIVKNSSSAYLFGAMSGAITGSQAQPTPEYQPSDPTLLQGIPQR